MLYREHSFEEEEDKVVWYTPRFFFTLDDRTGIELDSEQEFETAEEAQEAAENMLHGLMKAMEEAGKEYLARYCK